MLKLWLDFNEYQPIYGYKCYTYIKKDCIYTDLNMSKVSGFFARGLLCFRVEGYHLVKKIECLKGFQLQKNCLRPERPGLN